MAFNFGAFLGGFSEAVTENVKAQEKRAYEKELIEEERQYEREEYDRRQRAARASAAASARAAEAKEAEERIGSLISLGYSPDAAAEIARGGKYSVQRALTIGEKAWEKGMDVGTLYRVRPSVDNVEETVASVKSQIPEMGEISASVEEKQQYGWNREVYATLFGKPEPVENSYGAAISVISQKILREKDPAKKAQLEQERETLISDYTEFSAAGREPDKAKPVFDFGTLPSNINEALKNARNRYGFKTDIEGNIIDMTEGNEHKSYIAELSAAQSLDSTYGSMNDPAMNARIADMRDQANRDLLEYGRRIAADTTSPRLRPLESSTAVANAISSGQLKIGDVVTYTDKNGAMRIAVYTGIPGATGLPIVTGR